MATLKGLLHGELWLTLDILLGLAAGALILRLGFADWLARHWLSPFLRRLGLAPELGVALPLSLGSSRVGAALLASALEEGRIDQHTALWGTLMLPFPSYLRRWPGTFALAVGLAGWAGGIFSLFLLLRSAARFVVAFLVLRKGARASSPFPAGATSPFPAGAAGDAVEAARAVSRSKGGLLGWKKLLRTLPLAWFFFALAYALVPLVDAALKCWLLGGGQGACGEPWLLSLGKSLRLPLAGWTVAAGSIAHVSAALALAGGGMVSGELSTAQAVFALILGSALGLASRILRQNAGYYFGLFPPSLARRMLFWNFATILPFVLLSLLLAGVGIIHNS